MGTRQPLLIVGPAYKNPSIPANNQRCVNWYPTSSGPNNPLEADNPMSKGRGLGPLLRTMGAKLLANVGDGVCRGTYGFTTSIGTIVNLAVIGAKVYKLNFDKDALTVSPTPLTGDLTTSSGVVKMVHNKQYVFFTCSNSDGTSSGASFWDYTAGDTLVTVSDGDFEGTQTTAMIDGYFFAAQPGTANCQTSNLNQPSGWNSTNTASFDSRGDVLVALGQTKGELWGFGTDSIEVWYDAANSPGFPFSKRVGSDIDVGCAAPYSVLSVNGVLIWLDSRRFLAMSDFSTFFRNQSSGYQIVKLSDESIDAEWAKYETVADAVASTYNDRGHIMYEITFPTANKTWVYDTTLSMWHERNYFDINTGEYSASRTNFYMQYDQWIIGGCLNSNSIYLLSREFVTDAGDAIHRIRTTKPFDNDFNETTINELEIRASTGVQPNSIYNSDEQLVLSTQIATINTNDLGVQADTYRMVFSAAPLPDTYGFDNTYLGDGEYQFIINGPSTGLIVGGLFPIREYVINDIDWSVIVGEITSIAPYPDSDYYILTVNKLPANREDLHRYFLPSAFLSPTSLMYETWTNIGLAGLTGGDSGVATLYDGTTETRTLDTVVPLTNGPYKYFFNANDVTASTVFFSTLNYVESVVLANTSTPIYIGDVLTITLDDASTALATVTNVNGNTLTISTAYIDSSTVSVGNAVVINRPVVYNNEPNISLRYSNDSGYTWSYRLTQSLGKVGNFNKRVIWGPLGSAWEWMAEFTVTDPCDVSIIDAAVNIDVEQTS